MPRYHTVSFLSDFGHADEFVGVVHSVILSVAPHVNLVDITHGIAPHDVRAGGQALARAAEYLNPGVVVAVVDPGVGTDRRAVAVEVGHGSSVLVGPDNGLLGPAVALVGGATRAFEITNPEYRLVSPGGATFDGRDVFAPAAGHLCNGVALETLGTEIDPAGLVSATMPLAQFDEGLASAAVLWVDRYGNCQLNLVPREIEPLGTVVELEIDGKLRIAERAVAYDTIPAGRIGLVVDSSGLVSLAVRRGDAASELGLTAGSEVMLRALSESGSAAHRTTDGTRSAESRPSGAQSRTEAAAVSTESRVELGRRPADEAGV